jgi:hypothetical protein
VLEVWSRPDNPLFVPETIGFGAVTKYFYSALGQGAIGYAPFGMDERHFIFHESPETQADPWADTGINFRLFRPMARSLAALIFEGKVKTAVQREPASRSDNPVDRKACGFDESLDFGPWQAQVSFGTFHRLDLSPHQASAPDGRVLVASLGADSFLVAGWHCRVIFRPTGKASGKWADLLRVEEGRFIDETFVPERIRNGDETDWGLQFNQAAVLRVTLYWR